MNSHHHLRELVHRLVEEAYPELRSNSIDAQWGRTSCFATVSWDSCRDTIKITCNTQAQQWHEGALFGLLAHELSHPAQKQTASSEKTTDIDVIERGLGPYLAIERVITGKFEDHIIRHGKDMYLGYRTIRGFLVKRELEQLDALLRETKLIPDRKVEYEHLHHDLTVFNRPNQIEISILGHIFIVNSDSENPQVELITRDGVTHVYLDNQEIGKFDDFVT